MNITDETLMAYADGELDADTRAAVERAIAADSELAKQLNRHRALRAQLGNEFDPVLAEPIPVQLLSALGVVGNEAPKASIADLTLARAAKSSARAAHSWSPAGWISIAATLVIGIALGRQLFGTRDDNTIVANAELSRALSEQFASDATNASIHMGVSYLSKSGKYCRSFSTAVGESVTGLACRLDNAWQIRMLLPTEKQAGSVYRTAASDLPAAILGKINEEINGEPLDAEQEAAIAKSGWKSKAH